RMPFREATALVTVEREGVISSFVTQLSGKDPVVSVPMPGDYAPNVYVSVLAVRGRATGWLGWLEDVLKGMGIDLTKIESSEPTGLVDLNKPAYRLGIATVNVGWASHELGVHVTTDQPRYAVRQTVHAQIAVTAPAGQALPADTEVSFVAVDEALLILKANDSTDILGAMMGERALGVHTATAQMQVVGKRHYGRKAVAAGGGGGLDMSSVARDNFKPLLLWKGRVRLDASGHASVDVPLVDSLSSYKLVAVATGGSQLFGQGSTSIRVAQDLSIYSGIPPLVRSGDTFGALFTLHNGTDHAMKVEAVPHVAGLSLTPQTLDIPAGGAVPLIWDVTAPEGASALDWQVAVHEIGGPAHDDIRVSEDVIPAIPTEVWAASLLQGDATTGAAQVPLLAPQDALPGFGFVDVRLSDTLAPPMQGVRDYMTRYPYNCFEQRLSRIVVLNDVAGWQKLAEDIPAYQDADGLIRYFPINGLHGDEALTAYVLSVTAEAGLPIPADAKAKMISGLRNQIAGKLKHDYAWAADGRLLKTMSLGALARNNAATPQMLSAAQVGPQDMPTSILVDWLVALDRLHANPQAKAQAQRILQARLVYAGSRIDLTDGAHEPWYAMSSPDEAAIKALDYALSQPALRNDAPKMMVGVALRQDRGHWDTTLANAWGAVAVRRFAALFPASAITGTTHISLGSAGASRLWPQPRDAPPIHLALPFVRTNFAVRQSGGRTPWTLVSVNAAVPLKEPQFMGYRISRTVSPVLQRQAGHWSKGDVMQVTLRVEANAGRNWVVINDPIPPGATILNDLGGQSQQLQAVARVGSDWPATYVDRGNDGWHGFFEWVPHGVLTTSYMVRLNTGGNFQQPPTRVEAMYSPDIRGQLPNARLAVER
ncbi:MAG: alpha-2-macroglobulin, partial [Alphaproteobacteria bacterium]|nr:alpha-2-macroglobulin [Alphaproteobacteria bacterium]